MNQKAGLDFEYRVQTLFEEREIPVFETHTTNDFGADLVMYRNGKVAVIQCKCHSAPVGIHAVQEVVGAIKHYRADGGIVISNQPFTRQAIILAQSNHVLLIDGQRLREIEDNVADDLPYIDEFLQSLQEAESVPPSARAQVQTVHGKGRRRRPQIRLRRL